MIRTMSVPTRPKPARPHEPGDQARSDELVDLLVGVVARQRRHFENCAAQCDLSPPQATALLHLASPVPMRELAERVGCDASNVTGLVDRLEERGLLQRRPLAGDRRIKLLALTEQGSEVRRRLHRRVYDESPLVAALAPGNRALLRDLLREAAVADPERPQSVTRGAR